MNVLKFLKPFRNTKSVEDLIPVERFANDHVLLNSTGSAVQFFALDRQLDDECMSEQEKRWAVNNMVAANQLLDEPYRTYQYVFRSRSFRVPSEDINLKEQPHLAPARHIKNLRLQHLYGKKAGSISIYQAIEKEMGLTAKGLAALDGDERRRQIQKLVRELEITARTYAVTLSDVLGLRTLNRHEVMSVLQRILWPGTDEHGCREYLDGYSIQRQLRKTNVHWDKERDIMRVGRRFARMFSLKDLPDKSLPNIYGGLLAIDADLIITSTWQSTDRLDDRDRLEMQRNLIINFERHSIGTRRAIRRDPTLAEDLRNAGARDDLNEINETLRTMRLRRSLGNYSLTVLLHGNTQEELEAPAAEIDKVFRLPMAQLHEETGYPVIGAAIPMMFAQLPGNRALYPRTPLRIRNDHYAELSMVWGSETGSVRSSVLDSEYANVYETRMGPLFYQDTHYDLVAAELVTGKTRSGKTMYQNDRIAALQCKNPITRIYDVGGGYETLASYFGGAVLRCSLDDWSVSLNPLKGNPRSASFREFAFQFVRTLVETSGYQMQREDHTQLYETLRGLFRVSAAAPELLRLKVLRHNLQGPMKDALARWVEGGQYGRLFDNAEDSLVLADFQVYEFEKTEDGMVAPFLEPLQLLLIYRDTQTAIDRRNLSRPKLFSFDECSSHWRHEWVAEFIKRMLKTLQKRLVMISLLTQSPEDMGPLEPFILQNCSSFVFFSNPKVKDERLLSMGFDERKLEVFRSLTRSEFLFHAQHGDRDDTWKVGRLSVDAYRYWLYTTSPREVPRRDEAIREHGSVDQAIKVLAAQGGL